MSRRTFGAAVCAGALFLLSVVALGHAQAQSAVVTGKITGRQGEALGGAIVAIDELGTAVATTITGSYTLTVAPERTHGQTVTLRARYIGFSPAVKQITLTSGTQTQDFQLKFDPMTLDAVVVTGVAEATEAKKLTFAVGNVDASQLQQAPAVTALGSLEGKVAGVRLIQSSGAPGSEPAIRLRGATALTTPSACGLSSLCPATDLPGPLIIVDGTITRNGLADINSEDIERVEVVKGAAASSLYGSDAANGVVQVFTKRGSAIPDGKLTVTVRNEYGQSFRPTTIPTSLAHPYVANCAYTGAPCNSSLATGVYVDSTTGAAISELSKPQVKGDRIADVRYPTVYDHQGEILTHGAFFTNYVSLGQRKGNTNYNVSFENNKQDGVMVVLKGYTRQNVRVNVDQALSPRLDLSVGGFYGHSNNNQVPEGPGSPFFAVTFVDPNVNLLLPNPDGSPYRAFIPYAITNASNPLYTLANTQINTERTRYTGFGKATYRIFDWLSFQGNYNFDQEADNFTNVTPDGFLSAKGSPTVGGLTRTDNTNRTFNTGVTLTSIRSFQLGSWGVRNTTKAAFVYEDQAGTNFSLTANAFQVVKTPEFNAVDFSQLAPTSRDITIRNQNFYVISDFDIKDRYELSGLVRRDGSSLFGPDSRWQTYYRASGAYRLSQDLHINGIDELKVRASYGTAGLRPTYDAQYESYQIVGGLPVKYTLGNKALKPARSAELEVGTNIDFLGRFSFEYSYSRKDTKDQILLVPINPVGGFINQWQNAATLVGHTHELSLSAILMDRPDASWRLNIAADRTRQSITQANTADGKPLSYFVGPDYAGNNDVTQHFKIAAGEVFGTIYGTQTVRDISQLYDDPAKKALSGAGQTWSPDSVMINEEGYVVRKNQWRTVNERPIAYVDPSGKSTVKIADVNPDFNASFTTTLRYKSFSVYALVDWVQGGSIYNGTRQWPFFEYRDRIYDQSSKPAAPASAPYSTGKKPIDYYQFFYNSINPIDFFVEPGTYVKVKELNVSYVFGRSTLEKLGLGLNNLRVGVIGRNLFTFTKYSGYDPEVAGLTGDPFSFRFDGFSYPNFRTFTGYAEIDF
jgi:TonB-linked SusC/RagA family outer membrane protein